MWGYETNYVGVKTNYTPQLLPIYLNILTFLLYNNLLLAPRHTLMTLHFLLISLLSLILSNHDLDPFYNGGFLADFTPPP